MANYHPPIKHPWENQKQDWPFIALRVPDSQPNRWLPQLHMLFFPSIYFGITRSYAFLMTWCANSSFYVAEKLTTYRGTGSIRAPCAEAPTAKITNTTPSILVSMVTWTCYGQVCARGYGQVCARGFVEN